MGTAAQKSTKKSGFKKQETLEQYEHSVDRIMAEICNFLLADAPEDFNVKERYERGDDPATTARAAYDAIEG